MALRGTDPQSYITWYTLMHEDYVFGSSVGITSDEPHGKLEVVQTVGLLRRVPF